MNESTQNAILTISGQNVYIYTSPEILDFTDVTKSAEIIISTETHKVTLPCPERLADFIDFICALKHYLNINKITVLAWNIKSLYSYVLGRTGKKFEFDSEIRVYDLNILESYLGVHEPKPQNFPEAKARLGKLVKTQYWNQAFKIYNKVYLPLISDVVPTMETTPLAHKQTKQLVYSCYDLASGVNGRLKTPKGLSRCYLPHSLSAEEKENLRATCHDDLFMYFDFDYMEASILQWLTKDPALASILQTDEDLYQGVWRLISGKSGTDKQREYSKSMFLPVVYGMGAKTIAEEHKISQESAELIVSKIYRTFPAVMSWVKNQVLVDGMGVDYFGKLRKLDNSHLVRNFSVQSPASLICIDKLVQLKEKLKDNAKMLFHLHDGYCILASRLNFKNIYREATSILTEPSELYPELKLKVSCQYGSNLNSLQDLVL